MERSRIGIYDVLGYEAYETKDELFDFMCSSIGDAEAISSMMRSIKRHPFFSSTPTRNQNWSIILRLASRNILFAFAAMTRRNKRDCPFMKLFAKWLYLKSCRFACAPHLPRRRGYTICGRLSWPGLATGWARS